MEKATKISIVYLFLDACLQHRKIEDIFNRAQHHISFAQQGVQPRLVVHIDLSDLNFVAFQRGSDFMSTLLVVVRNRNLVNFLVFAQGAYSNATHSTSTAKYNNVHKGFRLLYYATAVSLPVTALAVSLAIDMVGVETVTRNSRSVSSRRFKMVSISSRVITSGGSTRITLELLSVPEMRTPRLNSPEATA